MKTAIVLGATGLIGKNLVELLVAAAEFDKVIAVTRRPVSYPSAKVVNQVIDFEKMADYRAVFQGDVLFSCLGTTIKQVGSFQKQRRVDVDYQYQAAQICAENNISHYLLVSSVGANKTSSSPYFKMKGELEDDVASLPFPRISVFRPSLLVGKRDSMRLGEMALNFLSPLICILPGLNKYRPISGREVAKKMVQVSLIDGAPQQLFELDQVFTQS